jgi:membrane protein required for colicin V production
MLDLFILAVLLIGLVRGFFTGIVRQAMSILGLIVAFLGSMLFMREVGAFVEGALGVSPRVSTVIGFILIFAIVQLLVYFVTRIIEKLLRILNLTVLNRLAGGAVGALKSALILSVLFLVIAQLDLPGQETRASSRLYGPVASVLPAAWNFVADRVPEVERLGEVFSGQVAAADSNEN